ncbi:MAG TPA: FxLYD domain-containing protein [Gemmatimonadaceae bacterium]|nr:FxLYD domain-containing protein [Gemmatimonadaceae bacterium]
MLATAKKALMPILLSAAVTAVAGAQQKPKECSIDENKPPEVGRALLALQFAQSAQKPEDAAKQLKSAVGTLEKADKTKNPVGLNFEMGKSLVMWLSQPNMTAVTTRGAVGFTQNPTQPIDLVASIDSSFSTVEKAMPECVSQTAAWRAQKGWVTMINDAIAQLNADHPDSAELLAKRSLVLNPNAPYGYMVLGNLAQKKNQPRQAIDYFKQTVEKSGTDTTYADLRRQTMLSAAQLAAQAAENASAADKAAYLADAKWGFETLSKDPNGGNYAEQARAGLASLASASGDTAAVRATYASMLANPSASSFSQLLNAGVGLARAKDVAGATTMFEAAYKKNPYHRDVLYNLAIMYMNADQYAKSVPVVRQLVAIDPSNGENYRLFTIAYANEQKSYSAKNKGYVETAKKYEKKTDAKSAKLLKAYADSAKFYFDSARFVSDSAVRYNTIAEGLPVKLTFNQFTTAEDKATLGGLVANSSDQSQTYTIRFDFLDASGKSIASETATVGPVAAGQSAPFKVTGAAAGAAAFKYAITSPAIDPYAIKAKS